MGILGPAKKTNVIDLSRPIQHTSYIRSKSPTRQPQRGMMKSASAGVLLNPIQTQQQQPKTPPQQQKQEQPQQQNQEQIDIYQPEEKQQSSPLSPVHPPPRMSHSVSAKILRPWDGEGIAAGISSAAQKEGWNRTESGVAAALEQRDPQVRSGDDPRLVVTVPRETTLLAKQHMHAGEHVQSRKELIRAQRQAPVKWVATDVASMVTYGKPSLLLNQHRYHTDAQIMDLPVSPSYQALREIASPDYQKQQQQQQHTHDDASHQHQQKNKKEHGKEHGQACICDICDCGAHKCSAPTFLIPRAAHYEPSLSSLYASTYVPYSTDAIPKRVKPTNNFVYESKPFIGESLSHTDYIQHPVLLPSQQRGQFSSAHSSNIFNRNVDVMHDGTPHNTAMTTSQLSYPGYVTRVDGSIRERTRRKVHGHQKLFYDGDEMAKMSLSHQELPAHPIHAKGRKESQERRQANAKSRIRANLVDPGYAEIDGDAVADAKFSAQTTSSDYADFSNTHVARAKRPVTPHFVTADLRSFESEYHANHRDHKQTLCPARNLHRSEPGLPVGGHATYEKVNGTWVPATVTQEA